jgi:hypothetical protein
MGAKKNYLIMGRLVPRKKSGTFAKRLPRHANCNYTRY